MLREAAHAQVDDKKIPLVLENGGGAERREYELVVAGEASERAGRVWNDCSATIITRRKKKQTKHSATYP